MLTFEERIRRQDSFFSSRKPNEFLYGQKSHKKNDEYNSSWLNDAVKQYYEEHNGKLPPRSVCEQLAEAYVKRVRTLIAERGAKNDDLVPSLYIHTDSGCKIAVLADRQPRYMNHMFWLEPNLEYAQLHELRLNPDNEWLQTLLNLYRALVRLCDGDYVCMPYNHRSPLDAANGLRGTELFLDLYEQPEEAKFLLNRVVDMELEIQKLFYDEVPYDGSCRTGVHGIALPPKGVWVNGDPVGLISREMMREFEQPYTGRLFSETGGGYFHNHTLGLYQADQVCATPGIYTQQFSRDPRIPTLEECIRTDEKMRQRILEASLVTPIQISDVDPHTVAELLPLLRGGRFVLLVNEDDPSVDYEMVGETIRNFGENRL